MNPTWNRTLRSCLPRFAGWRFVLFGVITSIGANGCAAARRSTDWEFDGVSFPPTVEGFAVENVRRWVDDPSLGIAVTYLLPDDRVAELTLYVYPIDGESLAEGDASSEDVLVREYESALGDLREYAEDAREVDELTLEEERDWPTRLADGTEITGRSARLMLRWDEFRLQSYLLVFVRDGTFIKIRFSHESDMTDEVLPMFERAVPMLLAVGKR